MSAAQAWALPDMAGEWRSAHEDVMPLVLDANSENVGRWTHRVYTRESPRGTVDVNFMEGSGPGPLRLPETAGAYGAVLDAKSAYHVIDVAGRRAALERSPLLPAALSVAVGTNETLTLEGNLTDSELTALAERLIEAIVAGKGNN
jgi:hypothetical protein